MKDVDKPYHGTQQIFVPPALPQVLRVFAKAAIRTQPYDLLGWSASYFKALAEGRLPPVKVRLEYPAIKSKGGLTVGYLKLLINQFSRSSDITKESLFTRWEEVCLEIYELKQILCLAGVYNEDSFPFYKFVAVAAGFLSKSLTQTMITLCELYSEEPEGGSAAISADLFIDLYEFLAPIDASKINKFIDGVLEGHDGSVNNTSSDSERSTSRQEKHGYNIDIQIRGKRDDYDEDKMSTETYRISIDIPMKSDSEDGNNNSTKFNSSAEQDSKLNTSSESNGTTNPTDESEDKNIAKVSLRVYSEEGDKIDSASSMSLSDATVPSLNDQMVTVKEQQEIITQILKTKEDKIQEMEAVMESLEDLAEKSKQMNEKANELFSAKENSEDGLFSMMIQKEMSKKLTSSDSQDSQNIDPNAKGVVNPVFKGLFDNVASKMSAVNAFQDKMDSFQAEVISVPPILGIGPPVKIEIMDEFLKYVKETAADQRNTFMPRDIRHCFCPPLEKL